MKKSWAKAGEGVLLLAVLLAASYFQLIPFTLLVGYAQPNVGQITPSRNWGAFFGTSGDININVNRTGIAVRVEVPREFLGSRPENDTSFIQTDIRNDYYYYNVIDEANHWTYGWKGQPSDGPCFKPNFSIKDPNAPWCVEIWNYLNGSFLNFTLPKFVRLKNLGAPLVAGIYNFTLFVANKTNSIGYPDFVHAWNTTLFVPVSMSDNPGWITGTICDDDDPSLTCPPILGGKGFAFARNARGGQLARAYVDQRTGRFNLTGLMPGDYFVQASAGVVNGIAYSLSNPTTVLGVQKGLGKSIGTLHLSRAPQVCGTINYLNSLDPTQTNFLAHSLSDHPYLPAVGFKVLNLTVEAVDPQQQRRVFRFMNVSTDQASDSFKILTGAGVKYVGLDQSGTRFDPYGTEFAGLPSPSGGAYQLELKVWISGYLQKFSETVTVNSAPGKTSPVPCLHIAPNPVVMNTGGVISGTIQFWNLIAPETPHAAEFSLQLGSVTDALFGGNILAQVFDHNGVLAGIVVINGTLPDGRTIYADSTSVRFYVIGFSEFYNRTWTNPVWNQKDYGLKQETQGYTLNVLIRGYEQSGSTTVTLGQGGNTTVTIRMTRGGAIRVGAISATNKFGTRALQAQQAFQFLNLSIPVRGRIYFYDSGGDPVGYVERIMVQGAPNGVGLSTFFVVFAGQNWSIRELWFYDRIDFITTQPTHITADTYSIKGFTLGYAQQGPINTLADLASLSRATVTLFIGNEIDLTGPIYASPVLFWHTPEHEHAIGQAFRGPTLAGAINANLTANFPTLIMPIVGFGAMLQNTTFLGQGHFFYVDTNGERYFDYGLDTGEYTANVPEFGFNKHFTQLGAASAIRFNDLFQAQSRVVTLIAMARIIQGTLPNQLVAGWVDGAGIGETIPLSWVEVRAKNSTPQAFGTPPVNWIAPTLDGRYDGVGSLNLVAGVYNVTFSVSFYKSQTQPLFQVDWNGTYALLPPDGPLCPTLGVAGVCDPPSPSPAESLSLGNWDTIRALSSASQHFGLIQSGPASMSQKTFAGFGSHSAFLHSTSITVNRAGNSQFSDKPPHMCNRNFNQQ